MKSSFLAIVLIAFGLGVSAQSKTDSCSFLKNLKFKNGRDTIVVKAILRDFILAPPRLLLKKAPSIYKYKFRSYLLFQPENYGRTYDTPIISSKSVDPNNILNGDNLGLTVFVTCVVFNESTLAKGLPDCLVIKVKPAIQTPITVLGKCNFLSDVHFSKPTETVVIKGTYYDIYRAGSQLILNDLNKKNLLNTEGYNFGITFQVKGCDEKFTIPYRFKNPEEQKLLSKQPEGSAIYLTCILFKNYYNYGMPFFIIQKFQVYKK